MGCMLSSEGMHPMLIYVNLDHAHFWLQRISAILNCFCKTLCNLPSPSTNSMLSASDLTNLRDVELKHYAISTMGGTI